MKCITYKIYNIAKRKLTDHLDEAEDIFSVDWDTYYASLFDKKEKLKFPLADFISSLPDTPDNI